MLLDTIETAKIAEQFYYLGYASSEFHNPTNKGNKKNVAEGILRQMENYHNGVPLPVRDILEREDSINLSQLEKECKDFLESLKK